LIVDTDPPDDPNDPYDHFVSPAPTLRRTRRRRKRSGAGRLVLGVAAVVVTAALVVAGVGFAYLGQGSISLESLQPAIAASLQSRLSPGFHVDLGPTAITRGPHGVGIGFSGLTIRDSQGRVVVNAPGGRIGLDAFALLAAQIKVRRLELDGLQLALSVDADGNLSLSAGAENAVPIPLGAGPAAPSAPSFGAVVALLAEAMAGVDQPLDHVAIVDGKLAVKSAARAAPAVYDELRLTFDRSGSTARASLSATGPSGPWTVTARAESGSERKLSVEAKQLAVDDFLRLDPKPPAFTFDSPVSFQFDATTSRSGALTALDGAFSLGAGKFDPHDPDGSPPIAIDEATGQVTLDRQGRFALDKIVVLDGNTHVRMAGWVAPPMGTDPLWRLHLHSGDIVFDASRAGRPAAKFDDVDLDAHFDKAAQVFETDKFIAKGPHLRGDFAARVRLTPAGPEMKLDLLGSGALLEALRLWPTFVNPDARQWCDENIKGGELASGSLKVDWDAAAVKAVFAKQAPPAESVAGKFALRDVAVDLLPGLPTTSGLEANGVITGRHFEVGATRGVMDLGDGRKLTGTDLAFAVPDTKPAARMPATGAGHISGGADALAQLLSTEALKKYVGVALDPAAIKGQFQGDLKLNLTLGKGVQPQEQKFSVAGSLNNVSVEKFLGDAKLEQGALEVAADGEQVHLTGAGVIFGSPAKLDVTKGAQDVGVLTVTGALDEAARAKLGFDNGPKLKGPVTLKLKAPLDKSGADVEVDLARASLDSIGGPPWKPAGKPGKATFSLKQGPDGVQVNNIAIDAGSLNAKGSAVFGPGGALKTLKLAPIRMSPSDDLKLELEGGSPNKLTIRGASLDARGVVKGLTGGDSGHDAGDLDLDVKVAAALGYNKERITGLDLSARRRNGSFSALEARGRIGRGVLSARGEGGLIQIKSDDAGALARYLDVYSKLEGGSIDLAVRQSGDAARGVATIRKFSIRDEPSLKQLEQAAPPRQSLSRGGNPLFGADPSPPMQFEKLTANFTRNGSKLEVRDGLVVSGSFGLKTEGYIDFGADKLDLSGVFVPLSQFNNALGGIPLLGQLLTGGTNEGVFAVNYRVSGSASSPTLTYNPLSAMTPGILRKMFGAIDGTTPAPSQDDGAASSYAPNR
jgi:hypothetical protein